MTNNTTPTSVVTTPKTDEMTSVLLPVGGSVGLGVIFAVGPSVGVTDGEILAVSVGVAVGLLVGITVGDNCPEGVADCVTCDPLAYTVNDC